MNKPSLCKIIGIPLLLVVAFVLAGTAAQAFEYLHENLMLSSGVFTAVFACITALGAKIYSVFFM